MKHSIVIAALMLLAITGFTQTISVSAVRSDNRHDSLHRIANDFSQQVRNALQKTDARVKFSLKLNTVLVKGKYQLQLEYKAVLVPCDRASAQKHFDRRGALSVSPNAKVSYKDAERRAKIQAKALEDAFDRHHQNHKTVILSDWMLYQGRYWTIQERFVTEK